MDAPHGGVHSGVEIVLLAGADAAVAREGAIRCRRAHGLRGAATQLAESQRVHRPGALREQQVRAPGAMRAHLPHDDIATFP